jgi:uncharacterized phosphosugar-binding protein
MSSNKFLSALRAILDKIETTQVENINQAATWIAEAIMADRFAVLFGSGHSFMPTMDTYPRIGSYPGWLPIHELATSYVARTSGDVGLRQALFLEKVEGYGKLVLSNYAVEPRDVMVCVSNSGVNTMAVEIALEAKKFGLKTIGVTSIAHSKASTSYHSSGKRLFEVVDLVLDTCVPQGDAQVQVPGFAYKVGSASTIAGCIIMQSLVSETAARLSAHNYFPPVFPSHNAKVSEEATASLEEDIERWFAEDARRIKTILR